MALAGEPDPLAVVDPRRDLDGDGPFLDHAPGAAAIGARLLDPATRALAGRAGLRADELAEDASCDLLQPSAAVAGGAGRDRAARLRAVPTAARAGDGGLKGHLAGDAVRGLDEVDLDRCGKVGAAGATPAAPAAEQDVVPEEGREEVGQAAEVHVAGLEAAAAQPRMAVAVVELACLGPREHLVRLDHLAEPLVGVRRLGDIRVELAREAAEGALDLPLAGAAPDSEQFVVVAVGRSHGHGM